ncbi:hypothetical protein [Benzoatithermus flavus]|uniref:OmpA-like domain-containing protein n=1 Tax=Benzoatithermus flavus TaxID=3108223 RepID=A0ABU8XKI5_9PROT
MAEARASEADEAGEGYFASISDLMVGVLFVFLLMLTVFALNFRSSEDDVERLRAELRAAQAEVQAKREEAARALREAEERKAESLRLAAQLEVQRATLLKALDLLEADLEQRNRARIDMLDGLERRLRERGVQVQVDQRSGVLRLAERDLRFPTRSAELTPEARQTVNVLADVFAEVLPCYAHGPEVAGCGEGDAPVLEAVLVEGHTDKRPISDRRQFRDNYQLSAERALTVYRAAVERQPGLLALLNPEDQRLLGVSGYGETRPLPDALGEGEEDLARNRRIDIRFVLSSRTAEEVRRLKEEIRRVLEGVR